MGVVVPEDEPNPNGEISASGTLNILKLGLGVCVGVGGVLRILPFSADCLGGDGGRVEDECRDLVKSREMDAVAVEVPDMGAIAGGTRREGRAGDFWRMDGSGGGCFSRIVRRDSSVRSTCIVSDDDESEEAESSSMEGIGTRGLVRCKGEELSRAGVTDRPRAEGEVRIGGGGDLDRRRLRVVVTVVEVVDVLDLRVDGFRTIYDDKTSNARFDCSGVPGDPFCTGKPLSEGSGVRGKVVDDRSPSVGGRMIALGSSVESTYIVSARGAGAIRSRRSWLENCN